MLVLGVSTLGAGLAVGPTTANATPLSLGDLVFEVPPGVQPAARVPGVSRPWPWQGVASSSDPSRPTVVVLARSDLASTDAVEVLGLLLAASAGGQLPGLEVQSRRSRTLGEDQGDQLRVDLGFQASSTLRYHGTLLIATRSRPPAAAVVILGDDALTEGTLSSTLDAVRWARMIRTTLRAWFASLVTLVVATGGLFAVSASSTTTSLLRMAVAAGVLSVVAAVAGLVVTEPAARALWRRVLWGGAVPLACGIATTAVVAAAAGTVDGLLAGLPWLVGASLVCALGRRLPDLRILGVRAVLGRLRRRPRAFSE